MYIAHLHSSLSFAVGVKQVDLNDGNKLHKWKMMKTIMNNFILHSKESQVSLVIAGVVLLVPKLVRSFLCASAHATHFEWILDKKLMCRILVIAHPMWCILTVWPEWHRAPVHKNVR